ncbi:Glycerol-3-phosphate dehydrogenase (NAD(P)+) [Spirochaeta thermophila DSM 6578]|uniref:Glycerol-3-phosphate dehydrogenase [NAD(P)+] n=1 Tax=Winmispira thermophila (strain ATCC 700085 / DSM 6578 / Z-1203) TaxID=869211 RepID=G0GFL3_WINT7|nr:NAD(P)H-dependent glycerol-3-phosphate dehydrogenase [Spirochaeta thermophila]AEJ62412.1 Glycerol-3-phosphate dehydrogenase (NAD(P)+) [Spirochaeta thermophila DSM 6578]
MRVNFQVPILRSKIGVIGAGAWGTAIAQVVAEKGHHVDLWVYEQEVAEEINRLHENMRYLPGVRLSSRIRATTDLAEAVQKKEYLLLVPPSPFLLKITSGISSLPDITKGRPIIAVFTKGFIPDEGGRPRLILEAMEEHLPPFYKDNLVYVSGPSHAEEVGRGKLTGLISASKNPKHSIKVRNLLTSHRLLVFSSLDTIGVQVSAAIKNVIAIAFGVLDALIETGSEFVGDNTESLLLAAGLNEIQALGTAMGSTHPETFTSIAGVGDLDVTCRSKYGRNRRFGREILLKNILRPFKDIDDLIRNISRLDYLPEGVFAATHAHTLAKTYNLRLPIIRSVYRILNKEDQPVDIIEDLLVKLLTRTRNTGLIERFRDRFLKD